MLFFITHYTNTEERIMRTFLPKTVNEQNLFEYFGPTPKGRNWITQKTLTIKVLD